MSVVDHRMQFGSRRICEFLLAHPGATRRQVSEGLGSIYVTVKKTLAQLERNGYVKREGDYSSTFTLTGKSFPPSVECMPRARPEAKAKTWAPAAIKRGELERILFDMVRLGCSEREYERECEDEAWLLEAAA
ncbi:hypothetical protein [Trinickia fusca]|uniref:MarR family transcriptional regulator n=1 Tax=Trinickia fusca TaxID=2419777 RepID=A0A494XIE6_9BURK|nr:hypothetical protein [Trinickia fusca]RKP50517.1 hypothetical protein D7S89_05270 [Trinickia fusca]